MWMGHFIAPLKFVTNLLRGSFWYLMFNGVWGLCLWNSYTILYIPHRADVRIKWKKEFLHIRNHCPNFYCLTRDPLATWNNINLSLQRHPVVQCLIVYVSSCFQMVNIISITYLLRRPCAHTQYISFRFFTYMILWLNFMFINHNKKVSNFRA